MSERLLSQLAHVEIRTPAPDESVRFYTEVLGLEESGRAGASVFLRGWGDPLGRPRQGRGHAKSGRECEI